MKVTTLDESVISDIGHAFGFYDYGQENGLVSAFSSRDAAAAYIRGYVRGVWKCGFLYTTSERGEGYIAYKRPGDKLGLKAVRPLLHDVLGSMNLKERIGLVKWIRRGGPGLRERMDKQKKPYVYVGMVCVREAYQGQGYMRSVMELAFAEGDRLGVPVILDTDAQSKCDKYLHLGMELAGTRSLGDGGMLYDLIRYPRQKD